jgi:hypothetical protein
LRAARAAVLKLPKFRRPKQSAGGSQSKGPKITGSQNAKVQLIDVDLARVVLLEVAQRASKMIQWFIFIATDFGEHEGLYAQTLARAVERESRRTGQTMLRLQFDLEDERTTAIQRGFWNLHHALKARSMASDLSTQLV